MGDTPANRDLKGVAWTPVPFGELIDKITILEIKAEKIADADKLANVKRELAALTETLADFADLHDAVAQPRAALKAVNLKLWEIEDDIRECERRKDFGDTFIQLARSVYFTNDERAALKRRLNEIAGSALVEEKSYQAY